MKVLTSERKDVGLVIVCICRAFASKLFPLSLPSSLLSWCPTLPFFFWDRQAPKSLFYHERPSYLSFPSSRNFRCVPCARRILFSSEYSKTSAKHCFSCWLYSKHGSARWVPTEVEIHMTGVTTKRRVISHLPLSTSFSIREVVLLCVTLDWCVLCLAYFAQHIWDHLSRLTARATDLLCFLIEYPCIA